MLLHPKILTLKKTNIQVHMRFVKKRFFLLLEVIIAFALVVLAILPMIYPNVYIVRSQYEFVELIELDHTVNLMYGEIVQRLYQNSIPWNDIESQKQLPLDEIVQAIHYPKKLPFKGNYQFRIIKYKPPSGKRTLYLVELIFNFVPLSTTEKNREPLEYKYTLYMVRSLKDEFVDEK